MYTRIFKTISLLILCYCVVSFHHGYHYTKLREKAHIQSSYNLKYSQYNNQLHTVNRKNLNGLVLLNKSEDNEIEKKPNVLEQVASKGLAGVLAIAVAEAIFWALGVPLASLYNYYTTGEWIDLTTQEGQIKASMFSIGYGGFATVILQYRVTLFAIPLVPIMENLVVNPLKSIFGDKIDSKTD